MFFDYLEKYFELKILMIIGIKLQAEDSQDRDKIVIYKTYNGKFKKIFLFR